MSVRRPGPYGQQSSLLLLADQAIVYQPRDERLQLRREGAVAAAGVVETGRQAGLGREVSELLERDAANSPAVRLAIEARHDLHQGYPGGVQLRRAVGAIGRGRRVIRR